MIAKPIGALELHYSKIQFLIISNSLPQATTSYENLSPAENLFHPKLVQLLFAPFKGFRNPGNFGL